MAQLYGNRWKVKESLGEGGQAHTILVYDVNDEEKKIFVLKRLKNLKRLRRFENEVNACLAFSHPNILKIEDKNLQDDPPYFVAEYCSGGPLNFEAISGLTLVERLRLFSAICHGVGYAHSKGIIHRDLKPDNIFLREDMTPVVGDFGLCFITESGNRVTMVDEQVGSRWYMAPELAHGMADEVRPASDVYSLGKVLYWMLAGRIFDREAYRTPQFDLTKEQTDPDYFFIYDLFDKMIVEDPKKRLANANEVTDAVGVIIKRIEMRAHRNERMDALEKAVSGLQQKRLPTADEIRDACHKATSRLASVIIDNQRTIIRDKLRDGINDFLARPLRYSFVLGPSGVGKSVSMAMESERLLSEGQTALLVRGKYFSLEEATRLITQELPPSTEALSWQQLMELLTDGEATDSPAFVILIDAIDEADDPHDLSSQLMKLHDSIGSTSPEKFRVILSCRDIVWNRFSRQWLAPLYDDSEPPASKASRRLGLAGKSIWLSDFTTDELDRLLEEIGATELLNPGRFGETPSPHVATVRDMLRHPATFEHYADLRRTSDSLSIQDITWSYLIEERLRKALNKAARQCGRSAAELRQMLERLAVLGWENNSKDFQLTIEAIKQVIPEIEAEGEMDAQPPLETLIENGVLLESAIADQRMIGFRITDIASYLLSFELERRSNGRDSQEFHNLITQWLSDTWNFPPLLDSLLAWADRLADRPYSRRALLLTEVFVETYHFHNSSIFGLMRPEVLKTIFEIVKRENLKHFYFYRAAALKIRPSQGVLEEIRRHLRDDNAFARQLAAELAGAHQDEVAIDELIQLLQDTDEDVRDKAYKAFGYIGKPAVSPLLEIIRNKSQSVELRGKCVTALRNIGYRNAEVSAAIGQSLKEGERSGAKLLERSLLAAAQLRDKGHAEYAIRALNHEDEWTIESAAKYLTEVPDFNAFPALSNALRPQVSPTDARVERHFSLTQLMAAIFNTDKTQAEPILLEIIREGLYGTGELKPGRVIQVAEKLNLAAIRPLILSRLIEQLNGMSERNIVWHSAKLLGKEWRLDHLEAMIIKSEELGQQGIDIARLFVNNIIPGIQKSEESRIGNCLNRVSDLVAVAKCQINNFAPEACRLFDYSGVLSCIDLCRFLWIVGDERAEHALIHRLDNPSSETEARYERDCAVRALGTCGTRRGADAVLNYMRSDGDNISLFFHRETLYPLLLRNIITTDDLVGVTRDTTMPWASRSMALLALGITDAPAHKDFFAEIAGSASEEERLREYAVRMLGFTKDKSVIPLLRHLLVTGEHLSVKSQAAECLAWLDDRSAVHEIERALEDSYAVEFVDALAHFQEYTSLPLLLDRLRSASYESRHAYLEALGAFWKYPEGKEAILEQFDRWSSPEERFFDNQSALIEGLVEHEPDVILDQFNKSFDNGQLSTAARETMSFMLTRLFYRQNATDNLLLETARRLVSDKHVPARERTAHALGRTDNAFCYRLFEELYDSVDADEWQKACAVYSLGFWESDLSLIENARYDGELLVRQAADVALAIRLKKPHLQGHIERYRSGGGLTRLSSYLCLSEKGDQSTIWSLHDDDERNLALTFRRSLRESIKKRLGDEYRKKQDEEGKHKDTRGTITFD